METKSVNGVLAKINPYIQRYCEDKYISPIKQFISIVLSQLSIEHNLDITEETLLHTPHQIVYDYKELISYSLEKVLKSKNDSFANVFFENLLKLIRGGYIDEILNGNWRREDKILYGRFFIKLVENISAIEGINIDEYIKFKDYVQQETLRLEIVIPEAEPDYYYWKYPLSYLKQFEELLLKYDYIAKHKDFESMFKSHSITSHEEKLIRFNGIKPELWYMLFRIYESKLNFMGIPLHKIASDLFVFTGKENTPDAINSGWQKFKYHLDENAPDEQYINKKLKNAHRLIQELNLPR